MSEAITTVKTETIAKSTTGQWYVFVVDLSWVLEPRGLAVALHLGLAATVLSYVLYIHAWVDHDACIIRCHPGTGRAVVRGTAGHRAS